MDQPMLLAVTFGRNQHGFAIFVFDPGQLHAQIANEVGAVEDVPDLACRSSSIEFIVVLWRSRH